MQPKQIVENLIDGINPITGEKIESTSAWCSVDVIRALYKVLQTAEKIEPDVNRTPASREKLTITKKPSIQCTEPKAQNENSQFDYLTDKLRTLLRSNEHLSRCAHCTNALRKGFLTLEGDEPLFVFCDVECFDAEFAALARLFYWIFPYLSSVHDGKSSCSGCRETIDREDFNHLNFVLHGHRFSDGRYEKEIAVLCSSCKSKAAQVQSDEDY